jgi:transcriptional regulator with GAF, ATPase, and Fis domain
MYCRLRKKMCHYKGLHMANNNETGGLPCLERKSDGRTFPLSGRLTTIGSSPDCRIILSDRGAPAHLGHILFTEGMFTLTVIQRNPPVYCNDSVVMNPVTVAHTDLLTFGDETFTFRNSASTSGAGTDPDISPLRRFITALSSLLKTGNTDVRSELLSGIAQFLMADGARLVIENQSGEFVTIARFPQTSGLDRFSERAIRWARQKTTTILMHDTDWQEDNDSKASLEINNIGSILCRPLFDGSIIRGYLYLDKKRGKTVFTERDREILDDVGPVFDELLAFYDITIRQRQTIEQLQKSLETLDVPIIFECTAMKAAIDLSAKFASTDSTILVTGETGTGKELFARFIHQHSRRSEKSFCAINCGALPENLIESELFGHEKGAFTGAYQKKIGLFEKAHCGTVFLDEIGEMPLNMQVKLLRVLQESEINPVGSTETRRIDVRVIAATNRDLCVEVKNGRFREDLLYRLNVLEIPVPPLRNRHRDALLLADFFIKKYARRFGLPEKAIALQAQAKILAYCWPGNVRQLENILQKALLISKGAMISESEIIIEGQSGEAAPETAGIGQTLKDARAAAELQCIRNALSRANGNVSMAARLLDVDRKWLTKLMKLHNISPV